MSQGGWLPPQETGQYVTAQGFTAGQAGRSYEMRPLSLGEVLDRTFAVYRANFWLFVGIAALSGVVQLLSNAIQLSVYRGMLIRTPTNPGNFQQGLLLGLRQARGGGITSLVFFLAVAITQAATVWALSEVYLGRPATILSSLRAVIGRWYRYVGIALWQAWSAMWVPLLLVVPALLILIFAVPKNSLGLAGSIVAGVLIFLGLTGGVVYGVIAFLRNSLGIQAAVVEQLKVRPSMRRSKVLTRGAKGRIFVVLLIAWCLFMVAGMIQMPLSFIIMREVLHGSRHIAAQAGMLLINFLAHVLVSPVVLIGFSLVYFDQRVRQEALDLLLMLGGGAGPGDRSGETSMAPASTNEGGPANDAATL